MEIYIELFIGELWAVERRKSHVEVHPFALAQGQLTSSYSYYH